MHLAVLLALMGCTASGEETASPRVDPALRITCGGDDRAVFTVGDLDAPPGAEKGTTPSASGLRTYLASGDGKRLPRSGYRVLTASPQRVLYAAGDAPATGVLVVLDAGAWEVERAEDCVFTRYRPGSLTTTWALQEEPTPGSLTFTALVSVDGCASAANQGRVMAPAIEETDTRVEVTFFLSPLPVGEDTCDVAEFVPATVTLRSRLGSRGLYDAGRYPPVEAAVAR